MQPARTIRRKNMLPIEIIRHAIRDRRVSPVRAADCCAHTETPFGKIQAVAYGPANAVVRHPANERGVDASLKNQIFEQMPIGFLQMR